MNRSSLVWRGLRHYWRTNLAVVGGVATAVAVLAGALLVGDSVRGSLRELVAGRLGRTDFVITGENPFREQLAADMAAQRGILLRAHSIFALEGIVSSGSRMASKVAVYGVDEGFWKFHGVHLSLDAPSGGTARLSPPLAEELAVKAGDSIVMRLGKPSELPAESLHGRKDQTVRTVRLTAGAPLPAEELGEFSLRPSQANVRAIFVSLSRLQRDLGQTAKANVILLSTASSTPQLESVLHDKATLEDLGVRVRPLERQRQLSLESASMVLNDALAEAGRSAASQIGARAEGVLTYLVNSMRAGDRQTPYSLVTALDLKLLGRPGMGAVLNEWAARDLHAKAGDRLHFEYYVWLEQGRLATEHASFEIAGVTPIRGVAADRDFAPEYPGITEANSIHDWDPPFPMDLGRIRKQDEDYWDQYRTTPKVFVPLEAGQKLWKTRFGKLTSLRVIPPPGADLDETRARYEEALRRKLHPRDMGLAVIPARQQGLLASQGATDFGQYFLYFSFFLVISALLLAGLFFRLGVEQRYREAGLLRALGFPLPQIAKLFAAEGLVLAVLGGLAGAVAAAAYAGLILYGLRTWWVDAIGTTLLRLHANPASLAAGALAGALTAAVVTALTVRALKRPTPRALLHASPESPAISAFKQRRNVAIGIAAGAAGVALLAASLAGLLAAAGGFFGAGAMFLIASLAAARVWLAQGVVNPATVWRLGLRNATHRPGRSVLSMSLIAFATFLIVALSAFRQQDASENPAKRPGTGGFALAGESVLPLIHNPGVPEGRSELGFPSEAESVFDRTRIVSMRLRPGDDASCLNLYQPSNPRVLGVPEDVLARFPMAGKASQVASGAIRAYVDANSLQYVLHKSLGDEIVLRAESGNPVRLQVAGVLRDSIFQSEILVLESDFVRAFPEQQGFRVFLIEAPAARVAELTSLMEERLSDYGLDLQSTLERLGQYHKVENAYISTFQSLGGMGLLLGTIGLGAVLLRNVLERRRELALLRAVGYQPSQLAVLVLAENMLLLACGLTAGTLCAALAIVPALAERGGALPLAATALLLAAVAATGLVASLIAVKAALRNPLLEALRSE